MNPKTVQVIMGHSSVNITMNLYCHVTEDTLFSEMQKFESGVGTADNISDGVKIKNHIVKAPFFKGSFQKLTFLKQNSNSFKKIGMYSRHIIKRNEVNRNEKK